jgi:hypothetical protein
MSKRDIAAGFAKFVVTDHKGVRFVFANGVAISIQWGPGNYCADYWGFQPTDYDAPANTRWWKSPDAEIALMWDDESDGREWLTREAHRDIRGEDCGDEVIGAVTPDEVVRYIAWAAAHPAKEAK